MAWSVDDTPLHFCSGFCEEEVLSKNSIFLEWDDGRASKIRIWGWVFLLDGRADKWEAMRTSTNTQSDQLLRLWHRIQKSLISYAATMKSLISWSGGRVRPMTSLLPFVYSGILCWCVHSFSPPGPFSVFRIIRSQPWWLDPVHLLYAKILSRWTKCVSNQFFRLSSIFWISSYAQAKPCSLKRQQ